MAVQTNGLPDLIIESLATDDDLLADMSREQLVELVRAQREAGVRISFAGKANARRLARLVRPRTQKTVKKYCVGDAEDQAKNVVIEGDNLQALVTLYRERGHVDLILTDPPYNTGNNFRYNDRWEDDPNDVGLGDFVREDDKARATKWMRFMWPAAPDDEVDAEARRGPSDLH
jgi:adenine-specific DNA-methyltransferase